MKRVLIIVFCFSILQLYGGKANWKETPYNLKQVLEFKTSEKYEDFFDEYNDAIEEYRDGDFIDAGEGFDAAYFYAEKRSHKLASLYMGLKSYYQAEYKHSEFKILKKLVDIYSIQVPFERLIDRELEIADSYNAGYRQPAFEFFLFSWMMGNDKSVEIYNHALTSAPFSDNANQARLDLAQLYLDDEEIEEAIEEYQFVVKNQSHSKEAVDAHLNLADIYIFQSKYGDGDSANARKALAFLGKIKNKYPEHNDIEWVHESFDTVENYTARHLYNIAYFYYKAKKKEAAGMYLTKMFEQTPNSDFIDPAKKLVQAIKEDKWDLEKVYIEIIAAEKKKIDRYPLSEMPEKEREMLKISDKDKWLLPMPDLKINKKDDFWGDLDVK